MKTAENLLPSDTQSLQEFVFSLQENIKKITKAGAIFYSILMTAKENGFNEHAYLIFIFNRIRFCKTEDDYRKLLPNYMTAEELQQVALK